MDVMKKLKKAGELYTNGDREGCMRLVEAAWDSLPLPKEQVPNAYLLVEYAVSMSLQANALDAALHWANFAPLFAERRHNLGEAEFLLGKVHFARDELDESKRYLLEAKMKSRGKVFVGEDPKYLRLIKEA